MNLKSIKKFNIAILIYARLNSKRLPKKVLKKINSKPLISLIIDRIKTNSKYKLPIIVCTSKNKSDDKLVTFLKKSKIKVFRGSLNNVFSRTVECSENFNFDSFVRVCADRPFFDVKLMDSMIFKFKQKNFDIVTNQFPRTYPKGLACEIAKINILKKIQLKKLNKNDKEHIFNYYYRNYKFYKIYNFSIEKRNNTKNISKKDWSLNNKNDLEKVRKIYKKYKNKKYIDILKYI